MLSATPLRVLLFKEGLARFCTEPYKAPTEGNMEQACHPPLARTPLATHPSCCTLPLTNMEQVQLRLYPYSHPYSCPYPTPNPNPTPNPKP